MTASPRSPASGSGPKLLPRPLGLPVPTRTGLGGGLSNLGLSPRTRPRGAGAPEMSAFSGEGLGLPPPCIASPPLPLLSPPQHHPPDLAAPCPHCVTRRTGKKHSGLAGILPQAPRARLQPLLAASAPDLPDSFLWACTPAWPSQQAVPGASQPHGSIPSSPPPASAGHGGLGGTEQGGSELGAGAGRSSCPTPAASGRGRVSVMGTASRLLNGHSSQRRLETRAVGTGDQSRGFGF